jgi:hypothetical protein
VDVFIWGAIGGVGAEIAGLFELRHRAPRELPDYLKSWFYWGTTAVMVALGGGLASAYSSSGDSITAVLALNIGASAPLILRSLAATAPGITK